MVSFNVKSLFTTDVCRYISLNSHALTIIIMTRQSPSVVLNKQSHDKHNA